MNKKLRYREVNYFVPNGKLVRDKTRKSARQPDSRAGAWNSPLGCDPDGLFHLADFSFCIGGRWKTMTHFIKLL